MPNSRTRDAVRTRALVLDAAERVFERDGWREATLAAIGAEAGVSRGTPAYFFRSKSGVLAAMAARLVDAARAAASDTGGGGAPERVVALLRGQLELVAERPALSRLAVTVWSSAAAPAESEPGAVGLVALERDLVRRIADQIDGVPGRAGGPDPFAAAAALLASAWIAALPGIPGGPVTRSAAALADRVTLMQETVRKLLADNHIGPAKGLGTAAGSKSSVTDLSPSTSKTWRLPGVG